MGFGMERLNYQHLFYFWNVAREGSVTRACQKLGLAQPTISGQLSVFEAAIGAQLFRKEGRNLVLTETGRMVFNYADEIFTIGRELGRVLRDGAGLRAPRLSVGVVSSLPKLLVYRLIEPVLRQFPGAQITVIGDKIDRLLSELSMHGVDFIIADAPTSSAAARLYHHSLGQSAVAAYAPKEQIDHYRADFPSSLNGAPLLLQTPDTQVRRALDKWFEENAMSPRIVAEIEDSALLKTFAVETGGVIFAPLSVSAQIERQYGLHVIDKIPDVSVSFFGITMHRKVENKLVTALLKNAREWLI